MRNFDEDEVQKLNAEQWQIDLLNLNPSYTLWGPHEDHMWKEKDGWDGRQIFDTWSDFGPWELDDLNECVNFYFSVDRESKDCDSCGGNGYHPDAQVIVNGFYSHMNTNGECWHNKITQDEVQALVDSGRLSYLTHGKPEGYYPTAAEVNAWAGGRGFGHDAINQHILIEARLNRLGIPKTCPKCDGHGYVYTAPNAHASLTLWWLHPRKGCSRGIEVTNIEETDLPAIFDFLRMAAKRNAERFSAIQLKP